MVFWPTVSTCSSTSSSSPSARPPLERRKNTDSTGAPPGSKHCTATTRPGASYESRAQGWPGATLQLTPHGSSISSVQRPPAGKLRSSSATSPDSQRSLAQPSSSYPVWPPALLGPNTRVVTSAHHAGCRPSRSLRVAEASSTQPVVTGDTSTSTSSPPRASGRSTKPFPRSSCSAHTRAARSSTVRPVTSSSRPCQRPGGRSSAGGEASSVAGSRAVGRPPVAASPVPVRGPGSASRAARSSSAVGTSAPTPSAAPREPGSRVTTSQTAPSPAPTRTAVRVRTRVFASNAATRLKPESAAAGDARTPARRPRA